jgi:glycosyltransferase involved in cell wall biosynthesis
MKQADRCFKQYVELYGHPDYVHVHVPIRAGLFAHRLLRKKKIPYALTEHYGIYNNEVEDPFLKRSQVYISSVRRIVRDAKPLIVVSQSLADDMNREVIKRDSRVIPNVVNKKFFNYSPNTNTSFIQFLHVSNMIPLKNVKGIIDAFVIVHKMLPHTKLFLIGRTNDNILEHAEKSGLKSDSLIFTGELPYEKVAEYMHQSHALVMFSNTESMSCVVAEALCCGLPVISTSTGIARDIINESNGLLVEKRNIKQLADAMYRVATGLYKYDRKMISSKAVAMFSYEVVGKQISDCYK